MAAQQCRAWRALADVDSSYGGLWRTYARVGYAAPFNTAEHLLPPGACSALLATAGGGRAKPCPQPAPGSQASSAAAVSAPTALSQSGAWLVFAHRHCHVQQHSPARDQPRAWNGQLGMRPSGFPTSTAQMG